MVLRLSCPYDGVVHCAAYTASKCYGYHEKIQERSGMVKAVLLPLLSFILFEAQISITESSLPEGSSTAIEANKIVGQVSHGVFWGS